MFTRFVFALRYLVCSFNVVFMDFYTRRCVFHSIFM